MHNVQETTVSVIVPVYNGERYLGDCLNSLAAQAGDDIEFLLIDDGSTDRSPSMLDDFAAREKRARVFHRQNGGVSAARNDGLARAAGRYLCFLDADDILSEHFASRVAPYLRQNYEIVYFSWNRFSRDDLRDMVADLPTGEHRCTAEETREICLNTLCPSRPLAKSPMRFRGSAGVVGYLVRADIVRGGAIQFDDGIKLSEDTAFRLRFAARCRRVVCLSDVLYFYRLNETSATRGYNERVDQDIVAADAALRAIVRDDYADDPAMFSRYNGRVIQDSRAFFVKYLNHPRCPLSKAERIVRYEAFRRRAPIAEAIGACDRALLLPPINAYLDALRVADAKASFRAARSALTPKRTLKTLADRLGVLAALKRLLKHFR